MEILSPPKVTCKSCNATFTFDKSDVKYNRDPFDPFGYVVCPCCGRELILY